MEVGMDQDKALCWFSQSGAGTAGKNLGKSANPARAHPGPEALPTALVQTKEWANVEMKIQF